MKNFSIKKKLFLLFLFVFISFFFVKISNSSNSNEDQLNKSSKNIDIANTIINHVSDSYEWHIIGTHNNGITFYLPIILWNNGLECFSSSQFLKKNIVSGNYGYYRMYHGKVYTTNNSGKLHFIKQGVIKNKKPWDFSITKNVISIFLSSFLLCYLFLRMRYSYKNHYPKWKFGIFLESMILFLRNDIAIPNIGKNKYKSYFPFLLTSFFFILINNLIGLIPMFPNVTGNISVTFTLAIITFVITNVNANKNYWIHNFWMPGVPIGIKLLLAPIEFIGIFIRPLTLCIRLFANITAGHILILSFICLIFIFKSFFVAGFSIIFGFFIFILEIIVSFLQAFIFTTLSSLLIGTAVKEE
ncbi:F0F1 ATP synthase subunit A [Blattabacterium cuenoti]|uniref:ATP synthase subunit a n=1 Tax=Blattabacterium sp. (Phyllodromica sp.) TaxID=2712825 RepID=A0A6G6BY31_9FLAO|nr:F0F1 ATP synthase subunit A [Blattabacterium cuenoti]QID56913.1 ATP synthase subunit A [Blattabacterium sp. (Phyllodromica sp.)]